MGGWGTGICWRRRICWWPRGRMVDSRLSRLAMDSIQSGSPSGLGSLSGLPRWAESRTAANSGSDSGVLTRCTHPGSRGIGHGESSGAGGCRQCQREPHRHPPKDAAPNDSGRGIGFPLQTGKPTSCTIPTPNQRGLTPLIHMLATGAGRLHRPC
jgi:hypothetical protein